MAIDLPRLIAAANKELVRALVGKITPERVSEIDWSLEGRDLGHAVLALATSVPGAWAQLQKINNLAQHGTTATVRSVLYGSPRLRDEFDELDGGPETAAIWLAQKDDELFEHCLSALHADHGLNKRSWKAFRIPSAPNLALSFEPENLTRFKELVREAIRRSPRFDQPGELAAHHFCRTLFPEHTHRRRKLQQVTVYAEARFVARETIVDERITTEVRHEVDSVSLIFDQEHNELDVVTLGGKRFIEEVANAFFQAFAGHMPALVPLIRRNINFDCLLKKPDLSLTDQSRFIRAKVDELRMKSPCGMLYTFDAKVHRDNAEDVYDIAKVDFGGHTPFGLPGWSVVSARIILFAAPSKPGRKAIWRTVDLKSNGHTNLREQEDVDLYIADDLLVRWGILEARGRGVDDD